MQIYPQCCAGPLWPIIRFDVIFVVSLNKLRFTGDVRRRNAHETVMLNIETEIYMAIRSRRHLQLYFPEWSIFITIQISLKFVSNYSNNNKSALVQVMTWCWAGDKPLPEPVMMQFSDTYMLHHAAVQTSLMSTRPGKHAPPWICFMGHSGPVLFYIMPFNEHLPGHFPPKCPANT